MHSFPFFSFFLSKEKLIPFDSVCKVLGVKFDLSLAEEGLVSVVNTEDRVRELIEEIDNSLFAGKLRKKDGERLRGRLQFASIQLFGRLMRNKLKSLNAHHFGKDQP